MPLRLEAFEQLPKHARRCVFWEVDPSTLPGEDHLADPEFEKEAWLSMVMLEWGSCGQLAVQCDLDGLSADDAPCLGYAFYAPPRAVPPEVPSSPSTCHGSSACRSVSWMARDDSCPASGKRNSTCGANHSD